MNTPKCDQLKRRYGPGVWEDMDGALHFSVPELLAHFDVADTPENRAEMEKIVEEMVAEQIPQAKVTHRSHPGGTWN